MAGPTAKITSGFCFRAAARVRVASVSFPKSAADAAPDCGLIPAGPNFELILFSAIGIALSSVELPKRTLTPRMVSSGE